MTRAVPPQQPALFEIALTCHRTHHTRFLSVYPGTDVAAWLAEHMGQPAPTTPPKSTGKAKPKKPAPDLPPLKAKLYAAVAEQPGTSREVATRTGKPVSSVRGRLSEMTTDGHLLCADGVYRVAP